MRDVSQDKKKKKPSVRLSGSPEPGAVVEIKLRQGERREKRLSVVQTKKKTSFVQRRLEKR